MVFFNVLSYILVLLGALNWGMFGIFDFNLVSAIFGADDILAATRSLKVRAIEVTRGGV